MPDFFYFLPLEIHVYWFQEFELLTDKVQIDLKFCKIKEQIRQLLYKSNLSYYFIQNLLFQGERNNPPLLWSFFQTVLSIFTKILILCF